MVFKYKDVVFCGGDEYMGDGEMMINVICVVVEYKYGYVWVGVVLLRVLDVKGWEFFVIVGGDDEFFVVVEVVLVWLGYVSVGVGGDGGWVD